jgi:hypothetical protein
VAALPEARHKHHGWPLADGKDHDGGLLPAVLLSAVQLSNTTVARSSSSYPSIDTNAPPPGVEASLYMNVHVAKRTRRSEPADEPLTMDVNPM